ncbi:SDR family NAD(P)-dependent oxidoreductase [Nocardia tengchongensis]|uniref:type I polyketide synthase n=1 Tax=Nocardia tengchongensis TaxID=2055889 RepID=UPI003695380B
MADLTHVGIPNTSVISNAFEPTTTLAVIGMAGRFGPADDVDEFWELLMRGEDAIGPIPADRWDVEATQASDQPIQAVGGFLRDVRGFDAAFFGISPREAADIDPQQRLMLETAWRALEDAGTPASALAGSRTGVYVGASWHDYEILRKDNGVGATQHSAVGNALDVIAARVSYFLRLQGPSLVVETGCSSSLVALDLARQAVCAGDVDAALIGGVNLILTPDVSVGLTRFGGLSPDGRCKAFAAGANGFVRAECVAALYVKRLDRALADGDHIRALVVTSAVNNDGGGESLVTPSPQGQENLLTHIYAAGGIDVDRLAYVEAHGTGTGRGDPIEAGAVGRVIASRRSSAAGPLGLGSVKTNIGHAEAAAGLAGLVKAVLALEHRIVPASLHAAELSPDIDFAGLNLTVVREPRAIEQSGALVGVNSFGWGGTNAHVVLAAAPEEAEPTHSDAPAPGGVHVLPISAVTRGALAEKARALAAHIADAADLPSLVRGLSHRRDHFSLRAAVVVAEAGHAVEALTAFAADAAAEDERVCSGRAGVLGRIAMVFPGQGGQWLEMAAALYGSNTAFTKTLDACGAALSPVVDFQLIDLLTGAAGDGWLSRTDIVQPALWAVSVALAAAWEEIGVVPDVVVGHSQGEVAAATVAGILTLPDAARVVACRSRLVQRAAGTGAMLAVGLGAEDALRAMEGFEELVSLAVSNSANSSVLSGDAEAILALAELLEVDGIFCRVVNVDYASHSPHMDPLLPELAGDLACVAPQTGRVPLFSTVRVRSLAGPELDADYWADNLREPVRFRDTMTALFDDGVTHVIEVGPHPLLGTALSELAMDRPEPPHLLDTLRRDAGSPTALARAFAAAYVAGLPVCTAGAADLPVTPIPGYPFQREPHWIRPRRTGSGTGFTLTPAAAEPDTWHATVGLDIESSPWIDDHKVHEATVLPGAAMVSLALRTGQQRTGRFPTELHDVRFLRDLTVPADGTTLDCEWRDDVTEGGHWTLRSLGSDGVWTVHATARARFGATAATEIAGAVPVPDRGTPLDVDTFYRDCAARGLNYGPAFRGIVGLWSTDEEIVAHLSLPAANRAGARALNPHPALLDALFQVGLAATAGKSTVVPVSISTLWCADHLQDELVHDLWVRCRPAGEFVYDLEAFDELGRAVLTVRGLTVLPLAQSYAGDAHHQRYHHLALIAAAGPAEAPDDSDARRWLVCGSRPTDGGDTIDTIDVDRIGEFTTDGRFGVVYFAPDESAGPDGRRAALTDVITLARHCTGLATPCPLVVVTTRAQAAPGDRGVDPDSAIFWGLARVLRREHPETAARVIDIDRALDWADPLWLELRAGSDDQVVLRGDRRWVGTLSAGGDPVEQLPPQTTSAEHGFRLIPGESAGWDGLVFQAAAIEAPGPSQVGIAVSAAALNFIDVMKAMGTYPDPVGGALLGGECAGRVVSVGSAMRGVRVGDRVVACSFGSLGSHVTVEEAFVRPIPAQLSDAQAAALPLVMSTAWYSLVEHAGISAGQTVLVHSAAGGLGLAAIAVARLHGATVIATAGTEDKRALLRSMGITHVFDSRDLTWPAEVLAATEGRGVDIVLNSLTGAAIDYGLEVLADNGHFIEVGKKDIYAGRRLPLNAFSKGISLSAVDIAGLMDRQPARFSRILDAMWDAVIRGDLAPLPITEYPFADAPDALRAMAAGHHVGKFVVTDPATVTSVVTAPVRAGQIRADGTSVITGGLGALGLSLAEQLVSSGSRSVALLSRSGPNAAAADRISALRVLGADVRTYDVDVSDVEALAATLDTIRRDQPPIRGVVHAAGLLRDATISTMTDAQIDEVFAPKVRGARNLDLLTAADPLDMFVLFSSVACLVGNPGQAAYAAANGYLDGLAMSRRLVGRPALSIGWGPFDEVGLAAADGVRGDRLADRGMGGINTDEAWSALVDMLTCGSAVVAYVPMDLRLWFDAYPDTAALPSWSHLRDGVRHGRSSAGNGEFIERFRTCLDDLRDDLVRTEVTALAGRVLRIDPAAIDPSTPFKSLGLDSLMSLEYRNRLESAFGLTLAPTLLWTYGTADALGQALVGRLRESVLTVES